MATYNATIDRKGNNNATLILALADNKLEIGLTEDNPNAVKEVFNQLLVHLKSVEFEFNLTDESEDLYYHICKEYISQLNIELKSTYAELRDNNLLNLVD